MDIQKLNLVANFFCNQSLIAIEDKQNKANSGLQKRLAVAIFDCHKYKCWSVVGSHLRCAGKQHDDTVDGATVFWPTYQQRC
jgi:hypothetical protein